MIYKLFGYMGMLTSISIFNYELDLANLNLNQYE